LASGGRFVVGLIGSGLGTSLSPPLHEREADELGLRYVYQLVDLQLLGLGTGDVGDLIAQASRMGFTGLNITHPCKQAVVRHLDDLSRDAATLGAVNTVVFTGGRSIGHNTDWSGFAAGFVRGLPDASLKNVVLLGAGGAGTAVAYALLTMGARRITVVDVARDRSDELVARLEGVARRGDQALVVDTPEDLGHRRAAADGVVNASAVGMTPDTGSPLPVELLRSRLWVADVVYRPLETSLLRQARELGCRTLNGGGMVAFQAAESFRLFTGRTPNPERMYRHMLSLTGTAAEHAAHSAEAVTGHA
jgi:shikimate dehydrogenase